MDPVLLCEDGYFKGNNVKTLASKAMKETYARKKSVKKKPSYR